MLAKLLKYEFKSTSRLILILYAAMLVMGTVIGLLLRVTGPWSGVIDVESLGETAERILAVLTGSLGMVYGLLIITAFVMTMVAIITRFYRNLLSGEGYLMHTLPVPTWMLVTSKLITAVVWILLTTIFAFVSVFLLFAVSGLLGELIRNWDWNEFRMFWEEFRKVIPLGQWAVTSLAGIPAGILLFYFSMALGNLANEHKVLFSVLAYIGINTVTSLLGSVIGMRSILALERYDEYLQTMRHILLQSSVMNILLAVGFFIGTVLILKKRLNLS